MAFTGGPLNLVGVVPSYTTNLGQQTSASGIVQAQNQVWQGAGEAFIGKPGQPLTGNLTGSPLNIALNPESARAISGGNASLFTSGRNVQAPSLTRFLGGPQSFAMNDQFKRTLGNAGQFGSLLSAGGGGGGLLGAAAGLAGGAGGAVAGVAGALIGAANYIMFPGGGGEGASNFSGVPYSLTDVTFSLQPANRGPQSFGSASATSNPTSATTLPSNQFTSMPPLAGSPTANALKTEAMTGGLSSATFTPTLSTLNFSGSPLRTAA